MLSAVPAESETLVDALSTAYSVNADLLAARQQLRVTNEQRPQALSNWLPRVTLQGSYTDLADRQNGFELEREKEDRLLDVQQPVFNGGTSLGDLAQAESLILQQRASLLDTEQQVLLGVTTAYMNVVRDEAILRLNENNVRVLAERLEATRAQYNVGDRTQSDLSQAEARVAQARAGVIQARGNLEASRANYEQVVGYPPGDLAIPEMKLDLPASLERARSQAAKQAPTVLISGYAEDVAEASVRSRTGELLPSVSFNFQLEREDIHGTLDPSRVDSESVALVLTVPLYQAGANHSRVREAKKLVGQRRLELLSAKRKAMEEAERSWQQMEAARAGIQAVTQQVAAARTALESVRQEVEIGRRALIDLLDAQQELFQAQVDLVGRQRDLVVNSFSILAAVGMLDARTLELPVEYYDPVTDYNEVKWKVFGISAD